MSNPNDRQVGGAHYVSEYQHWDLMMEAGGNRYIEGCASKYLTRWREKGGLLDLEKAAHYIEKLIWAAEEGLVRSFESTPKTTDMLDLISKFCVINDIADRETSLIMNILTWQSVGELRIVRDDILRLAKDNKGFRRKEFAAYDHTGKPVDRNATFEGMNSFYVEWQCVHCRCHIKSHIENNQVVKPFCDCAFVKHA